MVYEVYQSYESNNAYKYKNNKNVKKNIIFMELLIINIHIC